MRWTNQDTVGVIKCGQCEFIFPAFDASLGKEVFESKDGSAKTNYVAIVSHHRESHPDFYRDKWKSEAIGRNPQWAPIQRSETK